MIIQHVRHGRTRRDAVNLARHLSRRDDNESIAVIQTGGLASSDIESALAAMRRLAPKPTAAAFHHIAMSPAAEESDEELRADARRVLDEMGAHEHAFVIVRHVKPSAAGRATSHAHLVISHWSLNGKALDDGWLRLRLARLAREIEFDRGHPLTAGRHDKAIMKALRERGRNDVASALACRQTDAKPRSAVTSEKRQSLKRQGISDVEIREAVRRAWDDASDEASLREALAEFGLSLSLGRKAGVFIVAQDGVEIGALDRLLRLKRSEVSQRLVGKPPSPSREALDLREHRNRISAELDHLATRARQRRRRADGDIVKPRKLTEAEKDIAGLFERRRALDAELGAASSALAELNARRPRGIWAWLTGKKRRHRDEFERARRDVATVSQRQVLFAKRVAAAESRLAIRLEAWSRREAEIKKERDANSAAALRDLEQIADARRMLTNQDALRVVVDAHGLLKLVTEGLREKPVSGKPSRQPEAGAAATLTLRPRWAKRRSTHSLERNGRA